MINFYIINADFFEVQISTRTPERYPRIYQSRAVNNQFVKIYAIENQLEYKFDFQRVLFHSTPFSDITIDGVGFADAQLLANALNLVLYSNLSAFATTAYVDQQLLLKQNISEKNQPLGYAGLGADGLIPNNLISTIFDDVIDVTTLPATGEQGKIYQNINDNKLYRWSGTAFIEVSSGVSQAYVDTKVSLTGNETINGIKTFIESPIVPNGDTDFEAVNFRQLETKQDKFKTIYEFDYRNAYDLIGYVDIDFGTGFYFFGDIEIKINGGRLTTSDNGTYKKIFYNGNFFGNSFLNTFQERILFYDGRFDVSAKIMEVAGRLIIRIYKNVATVERLSFEVRLSDTNGTNLTVSPVVLPYVVTGVVTVQEPKQVPAMENPNAPIITPIDGVGNITLTDFDGGIFIDLATARQYVQTYTNAVITNETFSEKTYRFSVPRGTVMLNSFLYGTNSRFEFNDELGYISNFGNDCFGNNQNQFKVILGNFVTVGTPFLFRNQERFEFTAGTNFTAVQNCISQNIKYFKAKFGAFANLDLYSINSNFETFNVEIGDNSYLNSEVLSSNKKLFNAKIGSNCTFQNYAFYLNQLGFTATFGDNVTFGGNAFNDNIAGIIDVTFGNYLTTGADFYKNNASQNIIKIGNNATIGTATTVSLSANNNVTATIGDNFIGRLIFQNGAAEIVNIGNNATITGNSFYDSASGLVTIGNYLTCDNFYNDSRAKKITIESILLATNSFNNLIGRLQINGNIISGNVLAIGQTTGQDFTNCFQTASGLILILPTETETCNAGQPDGDIQVAISNGIDINNNLRYIL